MTNLLSVRSVGSVHGHEYGHVNVSVGKVLPATATGSIFTVTGTIVASLTGIVTTVFGVTAVSPTIGVTGSPAAIAAAPAAPYASTAVGSVIILPPTLGGILPAAVVATGAVAGVDQLEISNTAVTITTNATNAGAITWILSWTPAYPKHNASVVTN